MPLPQRLIGRVEQQVTLPEVDPVKIAKKCDIDHRAATAKPPHAMPTAVSPDLNEVAIEARHRDLAAEGTRRAEQMFAGAIVRGDELSQIPKPDFSGAAELAAQALVQHTVASTGEIVARERDVSEKEREKNKFQHDHHLTREPREPEDTWKIVLGVIVVLLIEGFCNMNALSAGLRGGLLAGLLLALVLAAANVGAGFAAGFAAREILHTHRWRKILGWLAVAVYLLLLGHWAALLGYYREMLIRHPEAASAMAVQTLRDYGIGRAFFSVEGTVLIGVTIGFGLLAMLSVFAIRDPYPGYARLGHRLTQARDALARTHAAYLAGIDTAVQPILAAISSQYNEWTASRAALRQHIADVRAVLAGYCEFVARVRSSVHLVCSRYRHLLATFSGRPVPAYTGSYDLGEPLDPAPIAARISAWEKTIPDQAAIEVLEKKVAVAQAAVRAAATKAHLEAAAFFAQCAQRARGYGDGRDEGVVTPPLRLPAPQPVV
jgi:hypothetical protein